MPFTIKIKSKDKVDRKGSIRKRIDIDINQDGKPFYSVTHKWDGVGGASASKFEAILDTMSDGKIGPIDEDDMIEFEIGMTRVSMMLNQLAIEDAEGKGRDVSKSKAAFKLL